MDSEMGWLFSADKQRLVKWSFHKAVCLSSWTVIRMLNVYSGVQIRNLDNACLAESSVSSLYLFEIWFLKISLRKKESRTLPGLVMSTR
jgi:hypothetical protein